MAKFICLSLINATFRRVFAKTTLLALLFLALFNSLFAQNPCYKNLSTKNGLPNNTVYHALQDDEGFMWFATEYGASRFDGTNFVNYDLQNGLIEGTILELYKDYKGRIWFISTSAKLCYFENGKINTYKYNDALANYINEPITYSSRTFILYSDGSIDISILSKGHYHINPKGEVSKPEALNPEILELAERSNRLVLYNFPILDGIGIRIISNKYNIYFDNEKDLNKSRGHIFGYVVKKDSSTIYINNNYLYKISQKGIIEKINLNKLIIDIYIDDNNTLWIGTISAGVYAFENCNIKEKPKYHFYDGETITSTFKDKNGGFWFTNYDNGIFYVPTFNSMEIFKTPNQGNEEINNITSDGSKIWFSTTKNNITCISGENTSNLSLPSRKIMTLFWDHISQNLFIGTYENAYKTKDNITFHKIINNTIKNNTCYKFRRLRNNVLYSILTNKLVYFSDTTYNYFHERIYEKNFLRISSIDFDKNNQLILGTQIGLLKKNDNNFVPISDQNDYTKLRIEDLIYDTINQNFWIATKGFGLILLKNDNPLFISRKNGLSSNYVEELFLKNGTLYVLSSVGIDKITNSESEGLKISTIVNNSELFASNINALTFYNNDLLIAADNRVVLLKEKQDTSKYVFPIYINNIKLMGIDTLILPSYNLKYNNSQIEINFKGIFFKDPTKIKYKYRLNGIDNNWIYTDENSVYFPYLPIGKYSFEVKAINPLNQESSNTACIKFIVSPPFWRTWWFLITIAFSIISIIITIMLIIKRIQFKEIKKRNSIEKDLIIFRQKALSQQMNPHFVFNTLNSIQYFILKNDKIASNKYLTMFSKLMRRMLDNSQQDFIILKDEIESLETYIRLEALRFSNSFEHKFEISDEINIDEIQVPTLIIQPYIENAIWHGLMHKTEGVGEIIIRISSFENNLQIEIEDNGIGREKAKEINKSKNKSHVSRGTSITQARLELITTLYNGKLKVDYIDLTNNNEPIGTKVILYLPLIKNPIQ